MSEVHNPIDVIHEELLGQLRDIVRVCNAHDIPYNLMCGTLLGAYLLLNLPNLTGENINQPPTQRFLQLPFHLFSGQKLRNNRIGQNNTIELSNQNSGMISGKLGGNLMNVWLSFIDQLHPLIFHRLQICIHRQRPQKSDFRSFITIAKSSLSVIAAFLIKNE